MTKVENPNKKYKDFNVYQKTDNECVMQNDFDCCPNLPHYSNVISDGNFIARNIALHDMSSSVWDPLTDINSTYAGGCCDQYLAAYPGGNAGLQIDEEDTMGPCLRAEFDRQECQARRWNYDKYFWQDLNQGRFYARGLSDDLDDTIAERNNFSSGWYNGKSGTKPGGAPYRNPYDSGYHTNGSTDDEPYNPQKYRRPVVNQVSMGSRSYKWDTIYDQGRYPDQFCRSGQYNHQLSNPREGINCELNYGEKYK